MNSLKQNVVALVALVIAIIAIFLPVQIATQPEKQNNLGAAVVTPTNYNNLTLSNQLIIGGADVRNDAASTTLALTDFLGNSTIIENSGVNNTAAYILTLPGTSTLSSFIPHQGDSATFIVYNASTTGPAFSFASSTDQTSIVRVASSTTFLYPTNILPGSGAVIDAVRVGTNGSNIVWFVSPMSSR